MCYYLPKSRNGGSFSFNFFHDIGFIRIKNVPIFIPIFITDRQAKSLKKAIRESPHFSIEDFQFLRLR